MEPDTSEEVNNASNSGSELWARFQSAAGEKEYFRSWLALQCSLIANAEQALLTLRDKGENSFIPAARWPEDSTDPERLAEISERVLEQKCGLLTELSTSSSGASSYGVAYPVLINEQLYGAVALELTSGAEADIKSAMGQLQLGVSGLELFYVRQNDDENKAALKGLRSAVDLLSGILVQEHYKSAAMHFVTELATILKCDRVSLGIMQNKHARVQAMSHSADFSKRMNLVRAIGRAMDESVVQRREILYPLSKDEEIIVVRDHKELARMHGDESIITLPLYGNEKYYGALTLERQAEAPFTKKDVEFCKSVSALAAPALEAKRLNDRMLIQKLNDSIKQQFIRIAGPGYVGRKLALLLMTLVVIFFSIATWEYRLSADTVLEGTVRRVVVAPFNGYIKEAYVRAGDVVDKDVLMYTLDDRELRLERLNWLSQHTQYQRQYQEALAKHDRAQVNIINAQIDQASAQLALVESKLERTQVRSPFKGIVISGDLSQRLGGLSEQGEVLFEVTPLDSYRVILQVDEKRIADVRAGQHGSLLLSSLPDEKFNFVIEKITPITTAEEGLNYFRVEAALENVNDRLRPGMEGVGKISVDHRKLISIWTRGMIEWLRLWTWSWWP